MANLSIQETLFLEASNARVQQHIAGVTQIRCHSPELADMVADIGVSTDMSHYLGGETCAHKSGLFMRSITFLLTAAVGAYVGTSTASAQTSSEAEEVPQTEEVEIAPADTSLTQEVVPLEQTVAAVQDTVPEDTAFVQEVPLVFPFDFSKYAKPDSAAIAETKFFSGIEESIMTYNRELDQLKSQLFDVFQITDTQKYQLESLIADENELRYLIHANADNRVVSFGKAINILGISDENIPAFAAAFLGSKGTEATSEEITWDDGDGTNKNVYHNGERIKVMSGDKIPFDYETADAVRDNFNTLKDWDDRTANQEEALSKLRLLEESMDEVYGMISEVISDSTLNLEEVVGVQDWFAGVELGYSEMKESLAETLTPEDYETVDQAYSRFVKNVDAFFSAVDKKLLAPEKKEKKPRKKLGVGKFFKGIAGYLGKLNQVSVNADAQVNFDGRNYAGLGLGAGNGKMSFNFGVLAHSSRDQSETPEITVPLPDGSTHYGYDSVKEEADGVGGFASLQYMLTKSIGLGVEWVYLPINVNNLRVKVEGQKDIPNAPNKEISTTQLLFENDNYNAIGATGIIKVPVGKNLELHARPGVFYNTVSGKTYGGLNVGVSVNLTGGK